MLSLGLTWYLVLIAETVYPIYASFKAVQSRDADDDKQWLTYWVTYGIVHTLEALFEVIINWIPLYQEIKLLVVIWMIAPQTNGALMLYERYIKHFLVKYASRIDPYFARAEEMLSSKYTGFAAQLVEKYGPQVAEQALKLAQVEATRLSTQMGSVSDK